MKRSLLSLLLFVVSALMSYGNEGDTIHIAGQVTGDPSMSVEALIMTSLDAADSSIVAYVMTDDKGRYKLDFVTDKNELLIRLTGFNVKPTFRRVKAVS